MRKLIYLMLVVILLLGCKSKEEKALELIQEELFKTLYDYESYSPIETTVVEAKHNYDNDVNIWKKANLLFNSFNEIFKIKDEMEETKEYMDIWGPPTFYSSSYSDRKYREYEKIYKEKLKLYETNIEIFNSEKEIFFGELDSLDNDKIVGWEVMHKFRCKTKGGYSTIKEYRYVIDREMKNILVEEDMDTDESIQLRLFIAALLIEYKEKERNNTLLEKTEHEYVDLGLSVKWATCNVGADNPEDCGDYFAWGEIETKEVFDWSTYKYCNNSPLELMKYCNNIDCGHNGFVDKKAELDSKDDVAIATWGGNWRMPTKEEQDELREKCIWEWSTKNGVNGYNVISNVEGYKDKSIFLPVAGYMREDSLLNLGVDGYYWCSSLNSVIPDRACILGLSADEVDWLRSSRCWGHSIRPVCP